MATATLPSITTTFMRAFTLYAKSYVPVFPFTVIGVLLAILVNEILPIPVVGSPQVLHGSQYLNLALQTLVSFLFFSFILCGCYQKHYNLKFDYQAIFNTGIKRFIFLTLSIFLVALPLIVCLFLGFMIPASTPGSGNAMTAISLFLVMILTLIVSIATIIFYCYFYISPLEIVVKNKGPVAGLKQSWQLIRGHWFKTFLILLIFLIPVTALSFFFSKEIGLMAGPLINLVIYPFGTSLMVIYHEHLEKGSQSMITTPEKN